MKDVHEHANPSDRPRPSRLDPGGTEILSHDLARALDAREGVSARFLAASTTLHEPDAAPGSLRAHGQDSGAPDRGL